MSKFKPGEPARIRKLLRHKVHPDVKQYLGRECVVDEVSPNTAIFEETFFGETFYAVRVEGAPRRVLVPESGLEKLTGSWDEIERTTGFRPGRSKQREPEKETA